MDPKNEKYADGEIPLNIPLATMSVAQNIGGMEMGVDNLSAGLIEYVGWQMIKEVEAEKHKK